MEKRDHPYRNLSLSRRSDSGKGDRNRVTDGDKFRDGWDNIDWTDTTTEDTTEGDDDE